MRQSSPATHACLDKRVMQCGLWHVCRHTACTSPSCQLCLNNPHKACLASQCLDQQYWVRDDARGGQLVKAKCGADVVVQLFREDERQPLLCAGVQVKLYVVPAAAEGEGLPLLGEPVDGLYLSDDGRPLWAAPGVEPDEGGAVTLVLDQEGECGPCWPLPPTLQFLDKTSSFRAGGRRLEGFRLLVRAVAPPAPGPGGASSGAGAGEVVLAQAASTPFKVTTKKAYYSCRKVEYLYGTHPLTDKTLPYLGPAMLANLRDAFVGLDTVEDLLRLMEAARWDPATQQQLRKVLNLVRCDKWAAFQAGLPQKVLREDSTPRLWWLPAAAPAASAGQGGGPFTEGCPGVGLVWTATRGQVDLAAPAGVVLVLPASGCQLWVGRITPQHKQAAGPHWDQLQQLAADSWRQAGHPGWRLVTHHLEWVILDPQAVAAAVHNALGSTAAPLPRPASAGTAPSSSGSGSSMCAPPSNTRCGGGYGSSCGTGDSTACAPFSDAAAAWRASCTADAMVAGMAGDALSATHPGPMPDALGGRPPPLMVPPAFSNQGAAWSAPSCSPAGSSGGTSLGVTGPALPSPPSAGSRFAGGAGTGAMPPAQRTPPGSRGSCGVGSVWGLQPHPAALPAKRPRPSPAAPAAGPALQPPAWWLSAGRQPGPQMLGCPCPLAGGAVLAPYGMPPPPACTGLNPPEQQVPVSATGPGIAMQPHHMCGVGSQQQQQPQDLLWTQQAVHVAPQGPWPIMRPGASCPAVLPVQVVGAPGVGDGWRMGGLPLPGPGPMAPVPLLLQLAPSAGPGLAPTAGAVSTCPSAPLSQQPCSSAASGSMVEDFQAGDRDSFMEAVPRSMCEVDISGGTAQHIVAAQPLAWLRQAPQQQQQLPSIRSCSSSSAAATTAATAAAGGGGAGCTFVAPPRPASLPFIDLPAAWAQQQQHKQRLPRVPHSQVPVGLDDVHVAEDDLEEDLRLFWDLLATEPDLVQG